MRGRPETFARTMGRQQCLLQGSYDEECQGGGLCLEDRGLCRTGASQVCRVCRSGLALGFHRSLRARGRSENASKKPLVDYCNVSITIYNTLYGPIKILM